jgi:hypothetical protein
MSWPYKTTADLLHAEFRFRGRVPCPKCGALIDIYQQLDQMPVFVDPETAYPHLALIPERMDPPWQPDPDHAIDGKSAAAGDRD